MFQSLTTNQPLENIPFFFKTKSIKIKTFHLMHHFHRLPIFALGLRLSGNKLQFDGLCGPGLPVNLQRNLGEEISVKTRETPAEQNDSECVWMWVLLCMECSSHHGFIARFHSVTLQDTDNNHLHDQEGVAHPNAVTRTEAKGHERIRVHLLPAVFTEPANAIRCMYCTRLSKIKWTHTVQMYFHIYAR